MADPYAAIVALLICKSIIDKSIDAEESAERWCLKQADKLGVPVRKVIALVKSGDIFKILDGKLHPACAMGEHKYDKAFMRRDRAYMKCQRDGCDHEHLVKNPSALEYWDFE